MVLIKKLDEYIPPSSQWSEYPNSNLSAVLPSPAPWGSPAAIMNGWSGAAFDSLRNRLLVTGGGHQDYAGNEVYAFDLDTGLWTRIWGPTENIPSPGNLDPAWAETLANGDPRGRHTYGGLEYHAALDSFWVQAGSIYSPGGASGQSAWSLDLTSPAWTQKADIGKGVSQITVGYDATTDILWLCGASSDTGLWQYDYSGDTWTKRANGGWNSSNRNAVFDPIRKWLISVGEGSTYYFDVSTPGMKTRQTLSTTGEKWIESAHYPGLAYHPDSGCIIGWHGGQDVYILDLDTAIWAKQSPGGAAPGLAPGQGTHGRFRYSETDDVFVCVNTTTTNVFKLSLVI